MMTTSTFDDALAQFMFARDHLNGYEPQASADEDIMVAGYGKAQECVKDAPAINLHDLRAKAEVLWLDRQATPRDADVLAFFADLRRLADNSPSRTFEPGKWLAYFEKRGGGWIVRNDEVFLLVPANSDLADNMFELEAAGGREAVYDIIRELRAVEMAA